MLYKPYPILRRIYMYFSEREGRKYICDNASVFNGICSSRTELVRGDFAGRFVASYRCLLQFLGASSSFSFTFFYRSVPAVLANLSFGLSLSAPTHRLMFQKKPGLIKDTEFRLPLLLPRCHEKIMLI